jgi:UDP-N-acetylmuramate dehydrogenase
LKELIPNYSLKHNNTFGIDCIARYYLSLVDSFETQNINFSNYNKILILGGGSNVVLPDYFDGLVIENNIFGFEIIEDNSEFSTVKVGGGENWDGFVRQLISNNIFGFENLALIPGKVGAAPIQNIGAYGIEQEKYFYKVEIFDLVQLKEITLYKKDCNFGYRDSIFKNEYKNNFIINNVYYKFPKHWQPNIEYADIKNEIAKNINFEINPQNIYDLVCQIRKRKLPDPAVTGNAGSFFKNPLVDEISYNNLISNYPDLKGYITENGYKLSAGKLIEKSGWKGKKISENSKASVSPIHSLVIIAEIGVTKKEIMELSQAIIDEVFDKFNVLLEREVNIIS